METWRLITTWDAEPGFNMALDEALLERPEAPPTLRLYTWRPDALSLGYFQRYEQVPEVREVDVVVRRLTGGGAIHHAGELTFSLVAPQEHPLYRGPVADSYGRVHGAVAEALAAFGVRAEPRGDTELDSDLAGSCMCFRRSTPLDLAWWGAKGVGSAQRRRGGRVLHHGSIKLGTTPLEGPVATVGAHSPGVAPADLGVRLVEALGRRFGLRFEPAEPTGEERERAAERADHFRSAAFLRRP